MDLYADNLADYIYQENDVDKKRALLLEVEAEIKKLMGEQEKGSLDLRHIGAVQIEKIQDLIGTRSLLLNQMFQATSQEIKRFEAVNELLNSLSGPTVATLDLRAKEWTVVSNENLPIHYYFAD